MSSPPARESASQAPSRLPLLYFAFAHLSLAGSLGAVALFPRSFAGFFYHPRMLAVVHLVTLGWITSHILGALYMIAPMALRTRLRATGADTVAFWTYAVGVAGMVAHFWIRETSGMLWAAGLVIAAIALVGTRTAVALRASPIEAGVKLHYRLAFCNVVAAGGLGMLLGLHRVLPLPFLTAEPLANLYAHAHLAALGWATMTVFGSAYRLLPMMLPSAPPPPAITAGSAVLLEVSVAGLIWSFLFDLESVGVFAAIGAAAVLWFLGVVGWMLRHRRRPGPALPRFDPTRVNALQALGYLTLTTGLGVALAVTPRSDDTLRLAKVYGVCGLLGFMGTMILGVAGRHVPVLLWTHRLRQAGVLPELSPYRLRRGWIDALELGAWSLGVPLLALALWLEEQAPLRIAACLLLTAITASAANHTAASRRARRTTPAGAIDGGAIDGGAIESS